MLGVTHQPCLEEGPVESNLLNIYMKLFVRLGSAAQRAKAEASLLYGRASMRANADSDHGKEGVVERMYLL